MLKPDGLFGWLWIWDWNPFAVAGFIFGVYFVMIRFVLMGLVERRFVRGVYKSFAIGGVFTHPLYFCSAAYMLRQINNPHGFYNETWWHIAVLALGVLISIYLEVGAVKNGQFTMAQEMKPSKLYHTAIFGVMFYWIVTSLVAVVANLKQAFAPYDGFAVIGILLSLFGFFVSVLIDNEDVKNGTYPKDAH